MIKDAEKPTTTNNKLFFPTLGDKGSIWLWLGLVVFFSFYDVFVQFPYLTSFLQGVILFFKTFINYLCIIFGIVGYVHFTTDEFEHLPLKGQLVQLTLINLLMTPLMTILAKVIQVVVLQDPEIFTGILVEIIVNSFLAILVTTLLVFYFASQDYKINKTQQRYQRKLLEQNAQLKARITPHFFFNMLNTVQSLVESDAKQASNILDKVARLYRFSFYDPKEIPLTDEIELCEHYLAIEKYRFNERLLVTWQLPDEDMLYDMVITSLTLQMLIEKMIVSVVEITRQTTPITITIVWENGMVDIWITTQLPDNFIADDMTALTKALSFQAQQDNLQRHFGKTATINYKIEHKQTTATHIHTHVRYPLADVV